METQATDKTQDKAEGFGAALKSTPTTEPVAKEPAAAKTAPDPASKESPEAASAQPPAKDPQTRGILKGIQAERTKRQRAEQENAELKARLQQLEGGQSAEPVAQPRFDERTESRLLTISENSARARHNDYDAKFSVFAKVAEANPALYETIMTSDDPGEAAYQAGKTLLLQEKYGADPEGMLKAVREETIKEERAKIRAEVEAEMKGKVDLKGKTPTNILEGGAATGEDHVPILGFSQLLKRRR